MSSVVFHAVATDFHRFGWPLFRHPDWFVTLRTLLLFRRRSRSWHVSDSKTNNAHSVVDDIVHRISPANCVEDASCSAYRNKADFNHERGHLQCASPCSLWANSGHGAIYSITSSASNCIEYGTVSPSTFAVPRFMTNSNFLGNSNGRSPAFSPLTILAA
jgi:hypothetical protein